MENIYLEKTGKLKEVYLPAIYFDTSVLIEYYLVEGSEIDMGEVDPDSEGLSASEPEPINRVLAEILKSQKNISEFIEIRKKMWKGDARANGIVSPLSLVEMCEWYSESAFKNIASNVSGYKFLQNKSKKQIGDYLKKTLDWHRDEKVKGDKSTIDGLKLLLDSTFLNGSFVCAHGLDGLLLVDLINFSIPSEKVWSQLIWHAYLQVGLADILHIALAQHLGCQYIASLDSDFKRLFDSYGDLIGMKLLSTPQEIIAIL